MVKMYNIHPHFYNKLILNKIDLIISHIFKIIYE